MLRLLGSNLVFLLQSLGVFKGNLSCAYFDTSYKIAADFENLLRMIFVGRIKTHYIWKDCVTMRTGGM